MLSLQLASSHVWHLSTTNSNTTQNLFCDAWKIWNPTPAGVIFQLLRNNVDMGLVLSWVRKNTAMDFQCKMDLLYILYLYHPWFLHGHVVNNQLFNRLLVWTCYNWTKDYCHTVCMILQVQLWPFGHISTLPPVISSAILPQTHCHISGLSFYPSISSVHLSNNISLFCSLGNTSLVS